MRLDLSRERIWYEPEFGNEAGRNIRPVEFRIGNVVGVEIANGAVHFRETLDCGKLSALATEAVRNIGQFLAERGRRCGLSMRARQHRSGGMGRRVGSDPDDQAVHQR